MMVRENLLTSVDSTHPRKLGWLLRIAVTALAYWIAGELALLMAIPPGYASAVWPAAGLALSALLVWGTPVAPGVLIGSFCVNVGTSFDAGSLEALTRSITLALIIALGAMLQAFVGAELIRRHVGLPSALEDEPSITRFTVLGGPVACLINPTLSVGTLCLSGVVPWSSFAFSWWTWWVGDAIGVLLFAPLLLVFVQPRGLRRGPAVALPLLGSFAVVTAMFVQASSWEADRVRAEFERRAVYLAHALESTLAEHEQAVGFVASLFYASDEVTRGEFREFAGRALTRYQGIQALGWIPLVPDSERASFERRARSDGLVDYAFRELRAPGQLGPAAQRAEYLPAYYLEPAEGNRSAFGFDSLSDPERLLALRRAQDTGQPSATAPLLRDEEIRGEPAVMLFVPVFDVRTASDSARASLLGHAAGVFRMQDVVDAALAAFDTAGLELALAEESVARDGAVLYRSGEASEAPGPHAWSNSFSFGGRRYRLEVRPNEAALAVQQSWQAWLVLGVGLLFARIMGVVTLMTTGRASRAQRSLEEARRTALAEEKFRAELRTLNLELEERVKTRTGQLSAMLKERDVLLQEIHHRVKNNLQVISSLINMQVRRLGQGPDRDALSDCQTRVQAIALIHESLYQSRDYAQIPFSDYAKSLSNVVFHAGAQPHGVTLELDIADVSLAVDRAIPCGLILNELISNALKHAFPEGRPGTVRVELSALEAGRLTLAIEDDGVGIPSDLDVSRSGRLGLQLVRTLAGQLDAELFVQRARGTRFELSFAAEAS
jgi:two-component sensor histidine kinase/integral membrane sensor domain MASE1